MSKKITVSRTSTSTKEISKCYHECPYFELDGGPPGPGPVMMCVHPDTPSPGYIISHPECDIGFPTECPLLNSYKEK